MVMHHFSEKYGKSNIGVACIYLNHKETSTPKLLMLLAGVWRQLMLHRDISSNAKELYEQHHEAGTVPSLKEITQLLSSCLQELSKVFIIVDAIDEYPEHQRHILLHHLAAMGSNVSLMITSRPNISPELYFFQNLQTLDIRAMPQDIRAYIDAQVKRWPRLSQYIKDTPQLRKDIHAKIIGAVDGM
jgi:hypothetical protein